jgi:putative hemolysin
MEQAEGPRRHIFMKNPRKSYLLFYVLCLAVLALLSAGCQATNSLNEEALSEGQMVTEENSAVSPTPPATAAVGGIPNPASVYCLEHGGRIEIRKDASGNEYGVCVFPDGSECEEWAYLRGECQPGERGMPAGQSTPAGITTPAATPDLSAYAFPTQIDPVAKYLFYLHGKLIEDQGLPAVSPDFGEYQYAEILQVLSGHGFRVISEVRPRDTDPQKYAQHVAEQVGVLLAAGIPAENITVVGASKGAGITLFVSNLVENEAINYVPMAICAPENVTDLINARIALYGNLLSIYDSVDTFAGSCADLFAYSEGKGIARHAEIVLNLGMGHGILYQPLDEWVKPVVAWAGGN